MAEERDILFQHRLSVCLTCFVFKSEQYCDVYLLSYLLFVCQVKIELMSDGKQLRVKPNIYSKPPLPTSATSSVRSEHVPVAKPVQLVGQAYSVASHTKDNVVKPFDKATPQAPVTEKLDEPERDPITLYTLLWIPEGSKLVLHEHHNENHVSKGLVPKSNLYLVCRMFWCDEVSKSRVCWGDNNPSFGFKQVSPCK